MFLRAKQRAQPAIKSAISQNRSALAAFIAGLTPRATHELGRNCNRRTGAPGPLVYADHVEGNGTRLFHLAFDEDLIRPTAHKGENGSDGGKPCRLMAFDGMEEGDSRFASW